MFTLSAILDKFGIPYDEFWYTMFLGTWITFDFFAWLDYGYNLNILP